MRQPSSKFQVENCNSSNIRASPETKDRLSFNVNAPFCQNHYDKYATHTLNHPQTHEKMYYCEKCSIMLASKGHNIIKLGRKNSSVRRPTAHKQPIKTERQRQIEQFIGQLSWHIQEINKKHEYSEQLLISSEQHFNNVMGEITNYFKQIEDILEIQKYMSYNAILNHRAGLQSQIRLLRQSMQHEIQELIGIGNDIQNNMEAVELVQAPIYDSIMQNYRQKIETSYEFHEIEISHLPSPSLIFPDIPKMLYSLADKINLKNDAPIETIFLPHNHLTAKPSLSNRSNLSRQHSYQNSRSKVNMIEEHHNERPKKSLSNLSNLKSAESIEDKQIIFSFQSNHSEENPIYKALFGAKINRGIFHPQEMIFRQSLSLTEIRQNDEQFEMNGNRRYGGLLQETIPIPEEVVTSQESIAGYFTTNTLNYSIREGNQRGEQTETLLIC